MLEDVTVVSNKLRHKKNRSTSTISFEQIWSKYRTNLRRDTIRTPKEQAIC